MTEARYRVEFILEKAYEDEDVDTLFDVWINEDEELHKRLVHQMAMAMASERWGVPIMAAGKDTDKDVINMVKGYVLHHSRPSGY